MREAGLVILGVDRVRRLVGVEDVDGDHHAILEIAERKHRRGPHRSYPRMARSFLSAKVGRVGMLLTEREREMA